MFELPGQSSQSVSSAGELAARTLLVHVDMPTREGAELLDEFRELALSAGADVLGVMTTRRDRPDAKYFVGTGKAQEIAEAAKQQQIELLLFNHELSPSQERNIERLCQCRVLDRTGLILDIFAQRAQTHEGKLQVELAQLGHLSTRLVRGWTHLERQKGGIGLRGPGETQLESDRRLIGGRIKKLRDRLERVQKQREQGRSSRDRGGVPTVSLVGYTNAGKSTLFNALTGADIYAADQLFATLDPTLRRLDSGLLRDEVVLADTVGFIRDLPHELVAAFRATLEETRLASLLIHVIDASDPEYRERRHQVQTVLEEIDAEAVPQLEVMNKIDACPGLEPRIDRDEEGQASRVWISAQKGLGLDLMIQAVSERIGHHRQVLSVCLPPSEAALRARLYEIQAVQEESNGDNGELLLRLSLTQAQWGRLSHQLKNYRMPPHNLATQGQSP